MCIKSGHSPKVRQLGVTLVELIVFIVIVSVALVGVLKVLEVTNKSSVDPLLSKQALAIAESLLIEIEQQPFTYCDPDDANAATASSTGDCAGTSQTESRYDNTAPFDNVADYNGFTMPDANCAGICNAGGNGTGSVIDPNLTGYAASVAINPAGGSGAFVGLPADAVLKIVVTVTGPANTIVKLTGYKVRYAPTL